MATGRLGHSATGQSGYEDVQGQRYNTGHPGPALACRPGATDPAIGRSLGGTLWFSTSSYEPASIPVPVPRRWSSSRLIPGTSVRKARAWWTFPRRGWASSGWPAGRGLAGKVVRKARARILALAARSDARSEPIRRPASRRPPPGAPPQTRFCPRNESNGTNLNMFYGRPLHRVVPGFHREQSDVHEIETHPSTAAGARSAQRLGWPSQQSRERQWRLGMPC